MANHKSAIKKYVRDEKKNAINRMNRSKMKTKIKLFLKYLSTKQNEKAMELFPAVISVIDKTIRKGTIHLKTGSRYKSRLTLHARKVGLAV